MIKETVEPEKDCMDKGRRETPLDVRVCNKKELKGNMKPERILPGSSLADMGLEAPG